MFMFPCNLNHTLSGISLFRKFERETFYVLYDRKRTYRGISEFIDCSLFLKCILCRIPYKFYFTICNEVLGPVLASWLDLASDFGTSLGLLSFYLNSTWSYFLHNWDNR